MATNLADVTDLETITAIWFEEYRTSIVC